jgi:DNA mismatch endonuclease, patch repair protein
LDVLTQKQRSRCMSAIKSKHTKPERLVRLLLRKMGYHYRLHAANLPGKPDIVLPKRKLAIFVHGCFWHCHCCRYGRVVPATNAVFWQNKRLGNIRRDKRNLRALRKSGWKTVIVWECYTRNPDTLVERFSAKLRKAKGSAAGRA